MLSACLASAILSLSGIEDGSTSLPELAMPRMMEEEPFVLKMVSTELILHTRKRAIASLVILVARHQGELIPSTPILKPVPAGRLAYFLLSYVDYLQ